MIRNLKVMGLAVVAAFAMSAVVASAASAGNGFLTTDEEAGVRGPATLVGKQTGGAGANALAAFGLKTECPEVVYTGHKYNVTPHVPIPNGAETLTINPSSTKQAESYGLCTTSGFATTVDMNGCDYVFHLTETDGHAADSYAITATVVCPENKHITLTLFGSAAKHSENKPFCDVTITEDPSYDGLHAVDTTNGHIDITGTIEHIRAHKESPTGSILCPKESTETAILHIDITVEGKNAEGGSTSIGLSHL